MDDQVQEAIDNENRITANDCKDVEKVLEFRRIVECEACYIAAQKMCIRDRGRHAQDRLSD